MLVTAQAQDPNPATRTPVVACVADGNLTQSTRLAIAAATESADAYTTEYVTKALDQLKAEGIDVAGTGYQLMQATPTEGGK